MTTSTNRVAIVTGASGGIGAAVAERLAKDGFTVVVNYVGNSSSAAAVVARIEAAGGHAVAAQADISDVAAVARMFESAETAFGGVDVLINNAGIMLPDDAAGAMDDELLVSTVTTNLLGPIRLTSAVIEHFKKQPYAAVINMSSVLGFVPLAMTAVYSSTKAALHSYTLSLRFKLRGTSVQVQEIAPPWVRTDLMNSNNEPRAVPLKQFIEETMTVLGKNDEEVLVESAKALRNNPGPAEHALVTQFNDAMAGNPPR